LCIGVELTGENELVISHPISQWSKSTLPDINKKPTVFAAFSG
jgi:hypothetical protein